MGWAVTTTTCDAWSHADVKDPSHRRTAFRKTSRICCHRVRLCVVLRPHLPDDRVIAITVMCMTC